MADQEGELKLGQLFERKRGGILSFIADMERVGRLGLFAIGRKQIVGNVLDEDAFSLLRLKCEHFVAFRCHSQRDLQFCSLL